MVTAPMCDQRPKLHKTYVLFDLKSVTALPEGAQQMAALFVAPLPGWGVP